ncbi:MAG: DUF2516 family protein [Rothia sp. (in: high G+C Gram-positive bacteria)]|nr:DUF2516 family protein [Rothia sp. (in: high G+C Gram-positive bacteria)]
MSPTMLVAYSVYLINLVLSVAVAAMACFALFEAGRASAYAYQSAFKRTKGFWVAVTGASALFSLLNLAQVWSGLSSSIMLQLIAATAVAVFLADVRPVVAVRRR